MRPPTAEEIAAAAKMTGDPIAANPRELRACRPAGPHKKPRGRPRKDGQPPHRTAAALEKEHAAAAAKVYAATHPTKSTAPNTNPATNAAYIPDTLEDRLRHFCEKCHNVRAQTFVRIFAENGHRAAVAATGMSPVELHGLKNGEEFRRLYEYIQSARDAATVARTCDTLADLANGEYKPKPNCLPPDMRAASLLMPALDQRFRAGQQGTAQQVQINIAI